MEPTSLLALGTFGWVVGVVVVVILFLIVVNSIRCSNSSSCNRELPPDGIPPFLPRHRLTPICSEILPIRPRRRLLRFIRFKVISL